MSIMRNIISIETREPNVGFSLRAFSSDELLKEYMPLVKKLSEFSFNPREAANPVMQEKLLAARKQFTELRKLSDELKDKPFVVDASAARVNRMSRSIGSDIFGIDYESRRPTDAWINVEHAVQETLSFNWSVAGTAVQAAQAEIAELQKQIYVRLGSNGVIVRWADGEETRYYGFASSASHQKREKLIMAKAALMRLHEEAIWFGLSFKEFLKLDVNGAAIWKMRANLLRPIRVALQTADGRNVYLHDIIVKKDITVTRHYEHARVVGETGRDGSVFTDRPADEERTLDDGGIHYLVPMNHQGQATSFGLKGFGSDLTSAMAMAAEIEGKEIPDFGGKLLMMGEGCWKFDKLGLSWDEFVERVDRLAVRYPGINQVWLLREGEEVEGVEKIRRLTRSLNQQWIDADDMEVRKLTAATRRALVRSKTLKGAVNSLSQAGLPESERSEIAKLFGNAPWLALNSNVQDYLRVKYEKNQAHACGNKLRTTGSYPYIQEDLVAIAQIQIFGADPSRKDLGVLKAGEMSVAGVEEDRKVLAIRFPANYLTARVRVNKPNAEAFASCGNVAMLSIYDDILVVQDGDVDGDEMAIILNDTAIKMTERMCAKFNPPTVLFQHGSKAAKVVLGNRKYLVQTMYHDLWKAKRFDSVGKYANLATLCCHLASEAYRNGDVREMNIRLNEMSLASTGAILAIDQVKGNAVSPELIARLDEIGKEVRKACEHKMPWTQQYAKGIAPELCMERSNTVCDRIGGLVLDETGPWELETGECVWNREAAKNALLSFGVRTTAVRKSVVGKSFLDALADNWFNEKEQDDACTFEKIRNGEPVGQPELINLLWRNACALEFRMDGADLNAKREEYYRVCREMLYRQACESDWVSADGYHFSDKEKKASVVTSAVNDILRNRMDGARAMFILKVFAKELNWSLKRNMPDGSDFVFSFDSMELDDESEEELYSDDSGLVDEPEMFGSMDFYPDDDVEYVDF